MAELALAVLAGDGIGPEITAATVAAVQTAAERTGLSLQLTECEIGWKAYERHRSTLPVRSKNCAGTKAGSSGRPLPANTRRTTRYAVIRAATCGAISGCSPMSGRSPPGRSSTR
jgi:isocitrate/isopropylmalate dehydrogenase